MLRNEKAFAAGIALAVLISFLTALCGCQSSGGEPLKVTLLKIGKADSIVVQSEAQTMVIDTGKKDDGEELVSFLEDQGCTKVDTLIITHFDKDHVGGAATLVNSIDIGQVLLPDYQGSGTKYENFINAMAERNIVPQRLTDPFEFVLGEASVLVEPPLPHTGVDENDNDFSLITTITHEKNRLLFTGDAEERRLREWLSKENTLDCNFLKIPHHGVYNSALDELLEAVMPEYAAICSSAKNPADQETLELLEQHQIAAFQTKDGSITVLSDGEKLRISQIKNRSDFDDI